MDNMDLRFCLFSFCFVCSFILLLFLLLCSSSFSHFWSYKRNSSQYDNLEKERRRRKKLSDNLYILRTLIPRSKLSRASILEDTIEFVKDLQKQVKELQDELEQPDDKVGIDVGPTSEQIKTQYGFQVGTSGNGYTLKQKKELDAPNDRQTQQMEPQVEVGVVEGNELSVKVFWEHRPGGFVKLMEAFNALRFEVIHATVTTRKGFVSHVFRVLKKENEMVEAEDEIVRDSLLELLQNPKKRMES